MWQFSGGKHRPPRRRRDKAGWIAVNGAFGLQRCAVEDISTGGAQIIVARTDQIPDAFTLTFSPSARSGRACRVVWRRRGKLGVRFEG